MGIGVRDGRWDGWGYWKHGTASLLKVSSCFPKDLQFYKGTNRERGVLIVVVFIKFMMGTGRRIITVLHVSVVSARSVLAIIRDNFLYIIIINIINQQSNTKNADNTPSFMTFCIKLI